MPFCSDESGFESYREAVYDRGTIDLEDRFRSRVDVEPQEDSGIDLSDAFSIGDVLTIAAEGEQEQPHKVTGWFEIDHWKYGKFFIPRLERCV